jgi:cyclophilin family peptidyl-prolyl cis-trans isomerase
MKFNVNIKKIVFCSLIFSIALLLSGCGGNSSSDLSKKTYAIMQTDLGEVMILLYDDTPIHKKNFIENTKKGLYDGISFHRIISGFMVQTGDPLTKDSPAETDTIDYSLKAEILEKYVHTEGKVGAARKPDDMNPDRLSSGSQFYIVTGKPVTYTELEATELALNNSRRAAIYDEFQSFEQDPYAEVDFETFLASKGYKDEQYYDQEKIRAYARRGGAPHLDFQYTIFGEVVKGMEIIKEIEKIPTKGDQPLQTVKVKKMEVLTGDQLKDRSRAS